LVKHRLGVLPKKRSWHFAGDPAHVKLNDIASHVLGAFCSMEVVLEFIVACGKLRKEVVRRHESFEQWHV
jgi:hypothetical protein